MVVEVQLRTSALIVGGLLATCTLLGIAIMMSLHEHPPGVNDQEIAFSRDMNIETVGAKQKIPVFRGIISQKLDLKDGGTLGIHEYQFGGAEKEDISQETQAS